MGNGYGLDNYPGRFFQNSVQIQCADKNAVKSKNVAYNKPFVLAQIKLKENVDKKDAWKTDDGAFKYFRCQFFAENIDKPKVGKEFNEGSPDVKSWSTDLTALKI